MKLGKIGKTKKKLLKTYILFALLLLLVVPVLHFMLIRGADTSAKLKLAFFSQKLSLAVVAMVFVLLLMQMRTIFRFDIEKREWYYLFMALMLFYVSATTFSNLDSILRQGVRVEITKSSPVVDFDSQRFFSVKVFNTLDKEAKFIDLDNKSVKRLLYLDDTTKDAQIAFVVYSKDFTNANFSLVVNNFTFNVTGLSHDSDIKNLNFTVDKAFLAHENNIGIYGEGISVLSESFFSEGRSFIYSGSELKKADGEAVIYFRGKNNLIFDILFKFGIVFRVIGMVFLFIFCFGVDFSRKCIRRYKKEVLAALIFTLLFFLAINLIQ